MKTNRATIAGAVFALMLGLPSGWSEVSAQTLDDVLVQTYNTNPRLQSFRARLRATDEGVATAMSGWRPTLTLSANAGVGWRDTQGQTAGQGGNGGANLRPREDSLTLSENLYRGGRTSASVRQADFLVQSDRATLLDAEQTLMLQAATAYMDVVRDQATLELNFNNERVLQRQLDATRDRFQLGELTRTDVAQAESRLASARATRVAAENTLASSRATYLQVVGSAPGTLAPAPPLANLPASREEVGALAADKAFPVVAANYTERAARENVDVIVGEMLPLVTLSGKLDDSRESTTPTGRVKSATLSVTASMPLYDSGSITSRTRQAKETAAQRRKEYEQQVRASVETASKAWDSLVSARAQAVEFNAQIRAAQIALEGVQQEARLGTRTVLDVLDAEQELLTAQVNLVRAEHDIVVNTYAVRSAVATLTATQLGLPVDLYNYEKHYNETRYRWFGLSTGQDAD